MRAPTNAIDPDGDDVDNGVVVGGDVYIGGCSSGAGAGAGGAGAGGDMIGKTIGAEKRSSSAMTYCSTTDDESLAVSHSDSYYGGGGTPELAGEYSRSDGSMPAVMTTTTTTWMNTAAVPPEKLLHHNGGNGQLREEEEEETFEDEADDNGNNGSSTSPSPPSSPSTFGGGNGGDDSGRTLLEERREEKRRKRRNQCLFLSVFALLGAGMLCVGVTIFFVQPRWSEAPASASNGGGGGEGEDVTEQNGGGDSVGNEGVKKKGADIPTDYIFDDAEEEEGGGGGETEPSGDADGSRDGGDGHEDEEEEEDDGDDGTAAAPEEEGDGTDPDEGTTTTTTTTTPDDTTAASTAGCPSPLRPYVLTLHDEWGDGWEPNAVLLITTALSDSSIEEQTAAKTIFSDTLSDGYSRTEVVCLMDDGCYRAGFVVAGSGGVEGAAEKYTREMHWTIRRGYDGVTVARGKGDIPGPCTFATSSAGGGDASFVAGCPLTCTGEEGGGEVESVVTTDEPTTGAPTPKPSAKPTLKPSEKPTDAPTLATTAEPQPQEDVEPTYQPGNLVVESEGLILSKGLKARLIAQNLRPIRYRDGSFSSAKFHEKPDFGASYPIPPDNPLYEQYPGGWAYVSNSEVDKKGGGVGSLIFDADGNVVQYSMILTATERNCGGGRTPWDTWITCEEPGDSRDGHVYEVHPFGAVPSRKTSLGGRGGTFESFAYDVRDRALPRFFVTEDYKMGALRRFTPHPDDIDWDTDPSGMIHGRGTMEYLLLHPSSTRSKKESGTFTWTSNKNQAETNAQRNYRNSEGLDVSGNYLYFVSKRQHELFVLNLDDGTYYVMSTTNGAFDGQPDQVRKVLGDDHGNDGDDGDGDDKGILYFTEDGGEYAGVHGRDSKGGYFTILESTVYTDETSGLAFSPDGRHMYICYQGTGKLFAITREDGLPFTGVALDIKYHNTQNTNIDRRHLVRTAMGVRL